MKITLILVIASAVVLTTILIWTTNLESNHSVVTSGGEVQNDVAQRNGTTESPGRQPHNHSTSIDDISTQAENKWWDDPKMLNEFYILFDTALLAEINREKELRILEVETSQFKFRNCVPILDRWTSNFDDSSKIESLLQVEPFNVISFCLENIQNQLHYGSKVPPIDLRSPNWDTVFESIPFQFHPKFVLQRVHNLDEVPAITPAFEKKLLELQLKHMLIRAKLQTKTDPVFSAYSEAISNFEEEFPSDSDLFPNSWIQASVSLADALDQYLEDIKQLEMELYVE